MELPEEETLYKDNDVVRVSIVLDKAGTIEAGYSTMDIASYTAAMNYRSRGKRDQTSVVSKIESAIKEDLDVVWNLTLAANIVSANVKFGQIELIEQVAGVDSVMIETRYDPDVVSTGAADPDMATSGVQIGSSAVWAAPSFPTMSPSTATPPWPAWQARSNTFMSMPSVPLRILRLWVPMF